MDGIAGIQSRIDQIVGRFSPASAAGGVLGTGKGVEADDFASTLARVEQGSAPAAAAEQTGELNRAGVDPAQWARDFLSALNMPLTSENQRAVVAWQQAEGTRAAFNPLATTQGGFEGTTNLNSVGVKNYASYADGIAANVKAITNGRYENVLTALSRGDSAEAVARAIADGPWGSGEGVLRVLASQSSANA
jgi:hypothetical protein